MGFFRQFPRAAGLKSLFLASFLVLGLPPMALAIPATPLMTVYKFNGGLEVPYYSVRDFIRRGRRAQPAGFLTQGTSLIPCLVLHKRAPLTDADGAPYVGFETVVDSRKASPGDKERFRSRSEERKALRVPNHHCATPQKYVIAVRNLHEMSKAPFFDPGPQLRGAPSFRAQSQVDAIVRAFHNSTACKRAQRNLVERRDALEEAWKKFIREESSQWSRDDLERARHFDYVVRTALFEGHLARGCNAYGACERNVIALSVRNRAREKCSRSQGCQNRGDFRGVAAKVSQYNIWDEVLTQISGLTSCFLREDLAGQAPYAKLQAMYTQSQPDIESILFGSPETLQKIFPGTPLSHLKQLRHYYHPPAMGKCFPTQPRVEYISGAIARRGSDFALIANTRVEVGKKRGADYEFRSVRIHEEKARDIVSSRDEFRGFLLDGRKVELRKPRLCTPYGTPRSCGFAQVGRHRRIPGWLSAGRPLQIRCEVASRGESCQETPRRESIEVGGHCDVDMQPVRAVP